MVKKMESQNLAFRFSALREEPLLSSPSETCLISLALPPSILFISYNENIIFITPCHHKISIVWGIDVVANTEVPSKWQDHSMDLC
jgi:hypothetical protein